MQYNYTAYLGQAGEVEIEIEIPDSEVSEYATDVLGLFDGDPEEWMRDTIGVTYFLDGETDQVDTQEEALRWVLKNVDHSTIVAALEEALSK